MKNEIKNKSWSIFGQLFLLFLFSCNFVEERGPVVQEKRIQLGADEVPSFDLINSAIIVPKCLACHNPSNARGGVSLDSFDAVKNFLGPIHTVAVKNQTMPPTAPLREDLREALNRWILAGAPLNGRIPTPTIPLEATFRSIKVNILEKKCLSCHVVNGPVKHIPLDSLEVILSSPRDLVIPGNSDESGLFLAVWRTDEKQMPPPNTGLGRLSDEEINIVKKWIEEGAVP